MNQKLDGTFGIIGAGVMGQTIATGLLKGTDASKIWAAARTQDSCDRFQKATGIQTTRDYKDKISNTDTLIVSVKPKQVDEVLKTLKDSGLSPKTLVISIAAGKNLNDLSSSLPANTPVIRAMPNTACVVDRGTTAICGAPAANDAHIKLAKDVFEEVGICLEIDESHFDAVTSLGASGPAFIFLIMEALADGGVRVGLPRDTALEIVTQVVRGASAMVRDTGRHPRSLRDDVTTPAGCTIAGLLTMEDGKIRSVLARAVEEATRVAGGLGN